MKILPKTLRKILVGSGYVSDQDFDNAAKNALELEKSIEDTLVFRGIITEDAIGKLVAKHLGVPFINIRGLKIPEKILSQVPEKLARLYRIVPFSLKAKKLFLAMEDPKNFEALEFVKRQTGLEIIPHYATSQDISRALGQYKRGLKEEFKTAVSKGIIKADLDNEDELKKAAKKLPVIKVLDSVLSFAVAEGASDVHIETQSDDVIVRFRVDGILFDVVKFPRGIETALVARIKILANLKIDEHRKPQDGRYKFVVNKEIVALRISIIPGFYGENVVMRLLHETQRPLSLGELGLSGKGLEIVRDNITRPHGMLLVTGPTGSGKTTTLYSILNILNTVKVKICTIEDPIEYGVGRVSQIQVSKKNGVSFASGLRALLRHDPDIIMVGEIRDKETAEIAVHSALTGHLVLSTLHTNTAAGAIPRFMDMGVEDFLLASTINVVMAQRLVRKICVSCVIKYVPEIQIRKKLAKELGVSLDNQKFYRGKGCERCGGKGYKGRVGIFEVLPVTAKIRALIVEKSTSDELEKVAVSEGMITMLQDGLDKISSGLTTIEEVVRVVREK